MTYWPILLVVAAFATVAISALIITRGEFLNQGMMWLVLGTVSLSLVAGVSQCGMAEKEMNYKLEQECIVKNGAFTMKALLVDGHDPRYYTTCQLPNKLHKSK